MNEFYADIGNYGYLPQGIPSIYPPFGKFKQWKVKDKFLYVTPLPGNWWIEVPANFMSDLASIPRLLRIFYGVNQKETVGAIVHDFLYRNNNVPVRSGNGDSKLLTRKECDMILYNLMCLAGTGAIRRWSIYRGVRLGGWMHFSWRKKK